MEDGLAGEGSGISISHSHKVQAQALDTVRHAYRYFLFLCVFLILQRILCTCVMAAQSLLVIVLPCNEKQKNETGRNRIYIRYSRWLIIKFSNIRTRSPSIPIVNAHVYPYDPSAPSTVGIAL